jgi:hypothetical protein
MGDEKEAEADMPVGCRAREEDSRAEALRLAAEYALFEQRNETDRIWRDMRALWHWQRRHPMLWKLASQYGPTVGGSNFDGYASYPSVLVYGLKRFGRRWLGRLSRQG